MSAMSKTNELRGGAERIEGTQALIRLRNAIDAELRSRGALCVRCGQPFVGDRRTSYCSQSCAAAARQARYRQRKP